MPVGDIRLRMLTIADVFSRFSSALAPRFCFRGIEICGGPGKGPARKWYSRQRSASEGTLRFTFASSVCFKKLFLLEPDAHTLAVRTPQPCEHVSFNEGGSGESMARENKPLLFGHVVSGRDGYGGYVGLLGGGGYSLDPAAFADFLQVISQTRPAIDAGLTMPAFPDKKEFRRLGTQSCATSSPRELQPASDRPLSPLQLGNCAPRL